MDIWSFLFWGSIFGLFDEDEGYDNNDNYINSCNSEYDSFNDFY